MNKILTCTLILLSMFCSAEVQILRPEQRHFANNHRYLVRRDAETIPGKVILYWNRGGKPDWIKPAVETQDVVRITGKQVCNPLQRAHIDATNNLAKAQLQFNELKAKFDALKLKNREASTSLDEISSKYPLLKSLVDKIKEKLKIDED